MLNGILWILRTGAPWADLPAPLSVAPNPAPAVSAVGPRRRVADRPRNPRAGLHDEGYLNLQEAFIDGRFALAKRGGTCVGKTKRGKGSKIMAIADRQGLPVAVHVESATPHEVTLVHATLAERVVSQLPARLIGDNAYESDRLDAELARHGVELIAPHRSTRHSGRKTVARCGATDGDGRSNDSLPGCRTFGGSSCAMSASPRTFSGCSTSPAASFCCGVYEMASNFEL